MLTFLGRGSGFSPIHNSAFFLDGTTLILIDCPMTSFTRISQIGKEGFTDQGEIDSIYVIITHTHGDHISGIPMLVHYCRYIWQIPITVAAPSEEVKEDMRFYLERLDGCTPGSYSLITTDTLEWVRSVIPVEHTPELKGRCFGYEIDTKDGIVLYTGDTNSIEPFKPYLDRIDALYTEITLHRSNVHLYIEDNIDYLHALAKRGILVYLMHLDDDMRTLERIKGTELRLAPLHKKMEKFKTTQDYEGVTKMNTSDKLLDGIYDVSERLYGNMSGPEGADHSDVFNMLTTLGRMLVGAARASFWKWDKASHTLWTTAATGTERIQIPDTTGLVGKALAEGRVIVTNDPYNDPDFNAEVDKKTGYTTKSILVMPVSNINGEFIGAYQVINKIGGDEKFDIVEDCRKLSLAAVICGLALESDVFLEESHTDKLTKLRNRMGFFNDIQKKFNTYLEDSSKKLSLFICDIDKFKLVNDTYGHNTGDEVLKHVASILSENCRNCDGVYRWGGEEFIMIMTDTGLQGCAEKAEQIRQIIEANDCVTDQYTVHHTMSFGVTEIDNSLTIEANISVADEKLYKAKESGRNSVIA